MKSIKYLLLGLAVGLMTTSCEKRTVEFDWSESTGKVSYQVFNMNLMEDNSANHVKYLCVGDKEYANNHSAILYPYNFAPSGTVGTFYTCDPCTSMAISMRTETNAPQFDPSTGGPVVDANGDPVVLYKDSLVYKNVVEHNFEADKKYQIFIYDYTKAPVVIDEPGAPIQENDMDSLGNSTQSGWRLYNFMFEADSVPTTAVIKLAAKYKKNDTEYYAETGWTKFGEASEWFTVYVDRQDPDYGSGLNTSGYGRVWCDVLISYDGGATSEVLIKNDYWTTYIGRAYYYILRGDKASKVVTNELVQFTAL